MTSIEAVVRAEQGRILASLIRTLGDWQVAEDAWMDALAAALARWPVDGTPHAPGAWLLATARRKGIDRLRRRSTRGVYAGAVRTHLELQVGARDAAEEALGDDRLSLVFTCCHPALAPDARVALTLRYVAGLTTREVARAFLVPEATMAKRLVRAKHKIADAAIPYRVPEGDELAPRLAAVCRVVYLVFTEGYAATEGDHLVRRDLADEAVRLARVLHELLPDTSEVTALLALLLLTHARRDTRTDAAGDLVLLGDQDRSRWDHRAIAEGHALLHRALAARQPGPYVLQACIADLHASAASEADTDWPQIAALYGSLHQLTASPVVRLNHAVAVAMASSPEAGLALLDRPDVAAPLATHHRFHAVRAQLLVRAARDDEARVALDRALAHVSNAVERRWLEAFRARLG